MSIPRYWRTQQARYRLIGSVCTRCEARAVQMRDMCPRCQPAAAIAQEPVSFFVLSTLHATQKEALELYPVGRGQIDP